MINQTDLQKTQQAALQNAKKAQKALLPALLEKAKARLSTLSLTPDSPTREDYLQIGKRFVLKRLLWLIGILSVTLTTALLFLLVITPPAPIEQLLGRYSDFYSQSTKAQSFTGKVQLFNENGTMVYQGGLAEGKYSGKGKLYDPLGSILYEGEFVDGLYTGKGKLYGASGELLYDGDFAKGQMTGTGSRYDGQITPIYTGEFKDGVFNGKGTLFYSNGAPRYEGEFKNGAYGGAGTEYYLSKKVRYSGGFLDGQYDGAGKLLNANGTLIYEGLFTAGTYNGKGMLYDNGVPLYDGLFVNGQYSGEGKELHPNGQVKYAGLFAAGSYNGAGELKNKDGKPVYIGHFVNGRYHGEGEKYDATGSRIVYKGTFKDGREDGRGTLLDEKASVIYNGYFKQGYVYYQGFFGLSAKKLEELIGKPSDIKTAGTPEAPKLELIYQDLQATFYLELSAANEKDSLVCAIEIWGSKPLQQIGALVESPQKDKEAPEIKLVGANGSMLTYRDSTSQIVYQPGRSATITPLQ